MNLELFYGDMDAQKETMRYYLKAIVIKIIHKTEALQINWNYVDHHYLRLLQRKYLLYLKYFHDEWRSEI